MTKTAEEITRDIDAEIASLEKRLANVDDMALQLAALKTIRYALEPDPPAKPAKKRGRPKGSKNKKKTETFTLESFPRGKDPVTKPPVVVSEPVDMAQTIRESLTGESGARLVEIATELGVRRPSAKDGKMKLIGQIMEMMRATGGETT